MVFELLLIVTSAGPVILSSLSPVPIKNQSGLCGLSPSFLQVVSVKIEASVLLYRVSSTLKPLTTRVLTGLKNLVCFENLTRDRF